MEEELINPIGDYIIGGVIDTLQYSSGTPSGTYTSYDNATQTFTISNYIFPNSFNYSAIAKTLTGSATNVMWDDGRDGGIAASGIVNVSGWTRNRSWTGTNRDASRALNINVIHTHDSQGGEQAHNNMMPYIFEKELFNRRNKICLKNQVILYI